MTENKSYKNQKSYKGKEFFDQLREGIVILFASIRLVAWVIFVIISIGILAILHWIGRGNLAYARFYWIISSYILRVKIKKYGKLSARRPLMLVSNHTSYFDMVAIGSSLFGTFVAKKEVMNWPLIGWLSKFAGTIYIDRKRSKAMSETSMLSENLHQDAAPIIVFPEGTTDNGNEVKPFKSAIFAIVEKQMQEIVEEEAEFITVQPISIAYTHRKGYKIPHENRDTYAWYIDPETGHDPDMLPHLFNAIKKGKFTIKLMFHKPINIREFGSRKDLAQHCHKVVSEGLTKLLAEEDD